MRSFVVYPLALASASWSVAALSLTGLEIAELAALQARQAPGSDEYQCHSDCGNTILGASEEGYCDDSEWQGLLQDCLECANKYDMWKDYGKGVSAAAKGCGIDAEPSPTGGSGTSAPATTSEPPSETSSAPGESSSAPSQETTSSEGSAPETSAPTPSVTGSATGTGVITPTSSPTQTFVPSSAIKGRDIPSILALGLSIIGWVI